MPIDASRRLVIEHVRPRMECERHALKREVGDSLVVTAEIYRHGHEQVRAALRYREDRSDQWGEVPMQPLGVDRWAGAVVLDELGLWVVEVVAWTDAFGSWLADTAKRYDAGHDIASELLEGWSLFDGAALRAGPGAAERIRSLAALRHEGATQAEQLAELMDPALRELVDRWAAREDVTACDHPMLVRVDPVRARFAAWYELFPRSMADDAKRHGTFDDVIRKLPYVRDMGFDVLYLPPIHPIGRTHRKGRNNSLAAEPGDPGSPYAIGAAEGGHTAVHTELGTLDDFRRLVAAAGEHGLEIALDFAIQASPDHPWVREHPEWFFVRPDGTIRCAENPPKRYEDIYPFNLHGPGWEAQWEAWRDVVLFWVAQGVKTFRVDNPHTKPVQFWEWLIREVQARHPDVVFLSEVFARPAMMRAVSRVGFTQSYTYFTWRNTKTELEGYLRDLTQGELKEYFRGNFFANTPDILPEFLQRGGPPAFRIRAVLAATLSSLYGIYCGFELCENAAVPGRKEEYLDSEKYQLRAWDWDRPGNIRPLITRLNRIRRENPALHEYDNLRFYPCDNDQVLFYGKATPDRRNVVFVAVSLDPFASQEATLAFPLAVLSLAAEDCWQAHELLEGEAHTWRGSGQRVRLTPDRPARIFSAQPARLPGNLSEYAYAFDPLVSDAVREDHVRHFEQHDRERARHFARISEGGALITEFDGMVRPYALRSGEMVDVYTALWILTWSVANQADYPDPEAVSGVRAQVAEGGVPAPPPGETQRVVEGLIYQFVFLCGDYEAARETGDPARLQEVAAVAWHTAANLGLRVDGVVLRGGRFVTC